MPREPLNLARLWAAVEDYFGPDRRRVTHARRVHQFAVTILEFEPADAEIVEAAAMLHDIGIPEAERKFGSAAGPLQEQEGPPVAREILAQLGADPELVQEVCRLIACHHSPGEVDTAEFDCLWDADSLVNLPDSNLDLPPDRLATVVDLTFRTRTGRALARKLLRLE